MVGRISERGQDEERGEEGCPSLVAGDKTVPGFH